MENYDQQIEKMYHPENFEPEYNQEEVEDFLPDRCTSQERQVPEQAFVSLLSQRSGKKLLTKVIPLH